MCQYIQLVKAVGNELDVQLGGAALRRLSDAAAAVGAAAARDSVYEQRQQTTALVRTAVSKLRDDRRRAGEMLERCENSLAQLRSASLSTSFGWRKGGNVTSAGWQVTLCDPMWHVSSCSGVATLRTAIHLLLTYSLISLQRGVPVSVGGHGIKSSRLKQGCSPKKKWGRLKQDLDKDF